MEFGKGVPIKEEYYFDIQRRVVAHKVDESWRKVPHVALPAKLDVTKLLDFVQRLKEHPDFKEVRVTLNSVLLKMMAECIKRSPHMNAHVHYSPLTGVGKAVLFEAINIAIPFITKKGDTLTTVLKDVGERSLVEVCTGMMDMRRRIDQTDVDALLYVSAQQDTRMHLLRGDLRILFRLPNFIGKGRLKSPTKAQVKAYLAMPEEDVVSPEELVSATCLVSNVGSAMRSYKGVPALLEVVPPQAVAIGLSAVCKEPVVETDASGKDQVVIRSMMPYSLCFDHRLMDFKHVIGFLEAMDEFCADPDRLLKD